MNSLYAAVTRLQGRLSEAGILSAVIGGIAVSIWSRPRATEDVDFKVLLGRDSAEQLLALLGSDYVPLQSDPLDALRQHGVLFVRDESGVRVDIQLADVSLDEAAIRRAVVVELEPGATARVCTAEDLIVYKMISIRPQDRIDVENVIRRRGDSLDDTYVTGWLRQLEQALDEADLVRTYQELRRMSSRQV